MDINDWIQLIYQAAALIMQTAGIWMILKKCGVKGWHALIPGDRYYRLGIVGGRETDGMIALYADIARIGAQWAFTNVEKTDEYYIVYLMAALIIMMIALVYEIRVLLGVLRTFRMKWYWIIPWIFVPWLPAWLMGFINRFQPVDLGVYDEDELLAGKAPAEIASADSRDSRSGLNIHVRSRSVRQHFSRRYLLKDVNVSIPRGSLVLLLGGSGAGKTTLINAVIGYEKADATITLDGKDVYKNYSEMKYRIGFVPQQDLLRLNDSVMNTLYDAAKLRLPKNVKAKEREEKVNDVIETLGLAGRQNGLVAKKSGGQKKRISIGMELISDPDLFILDEPDSGLDGVIARELFEKLRGIADRGKIVIAITHTPDRVADLFDQVIVLARDSGRCGRLAFSGTPQEAMEFFERDSMEKIVMAVNRTSEGGEGRADEFIARFAELKAERGKA